jgi:DNA-binding PadR family transcriptional regulator
VRLLQPVLLLLIDKEKSHGYDLLDALAQYQLGTIHPSMVYRVLREMESMGWVTSSWDAQQTQGPPRRVYTLTSLGQEAVEVWRSELRQVRGIIDNLLDLV